MSEAQAEKVSTRRNPLEILRSGGSAKLAAEQLVGMLQNGLEDEIGARLDWLTERLDALAARLDGVLDAPASAGAASSGASPESVRTTLEQVLAEDSGRELLAETVRAQIAEAPPPGADALKSAAGALLKEFLSENLAAIFQREVQKIVRGEVEEVLGTDAVKELIDEKFRAVSIYLKTEVIPKAVRQAMTSA